MEAPIDRMISAYMMGRSGTNSASLASWPMDRPRNGSGSARADAPSAQNPKASTAATTTRRMSGMR